MKITEIENRSLLEAINKRKFSIAEAIQIIEEAPAPPYWRERNSILAVLSDGTSGPDWIPRLENNGWEVDGYAKEILLSDDFKPTKGVLTYVILYRSMPANNISDICDEAKRMNQKKPSAEVACLICELLSQKEFYERGIVALAIMHQPVTPRSGYDGIPGTLCIDNVFNNSDKKRLTAMGLIPNTRLSGWSYAFEK